MNPTIVQMNFLYSLILIANIIRFIGTINVLSHSMNIFMLPSSLIASLTISLYIYLIPLCPRVYVTLQMV